MCPATMKIPTAIELHSSNQDTFNPRVPLLISSCSSQANHLTQGATSKDNCHEQACYARILRLARGHLTQLDMRAQRGNRAKRTREL